MLDDSDEEEIDESQLSVDILRRKPQKPNDEDCCGHGCKLCVFDIFKQEMKMWRDLCKNHVSGNISEDFETGAMNCDRYNKFEISKITLITNNSNIYKFILPGGKCLGGEAVQHLIARGYTENDCVTRQYTPVSKLDAKGYFDVLIKLYKNGKMSECIRSWQIGTKVEWRGTFSQFVYVTNQYKCVLLLAAGTGIAPMIQIIRAILENDNDETRIHLVYGCRDYNAILMKDFLDCCKEYWNFKVSYCLSQHYNLTDIKYGDDVTHKRIDEFVIRQKIHEIGIDEKNLIAICGPKTFNEDLKNVCEAMEIKAQNLFFF